MLARLYRALPVSLLVRESLLPSFTRPEELVKSVEKMLGNKLMDLINYIDENTEKCSEDGYMDVFEYIGTMFLLANQRWLAANDKHRHPSHTMQTITPYARKCNSLFADNRYMNRFMRAIQGTNLQIAIFCIARMRTRKMANYFMIGNNLSIDMKLPEFKNVVALVEQIHQLFNDSPDADSEHRLLHVIQTVGVDTDVINGGSGFELNRWDYVILRRGFRYSNEGTTIKTITPEDFVSDEKK